jgi:hypothetical protein
MWQTGRRRRVQRTLPAATITVAAESTGSDGVTVASVPASNSHSARLDTRSGSANSLDLAATITTAAAPRQSNSLGEASVGAISSGSTNSSSSLTTEADVGVQAIGSAAGVGQGDGTGNGRMRRTLRRMRMAGLGFQVCLSEALSGCNGEEPETTSHPEYDWQHDALKPVFPVTDYSPLIQTCVP